MPSFDAEAIRQALPIERLLEVRGIPLRRGRGPCPVCGTSEKSTSFSVRGCNWRCFACGAHGDVIDLVARLDGVPLREAFERGASLAGIRSLRRCDRVAQRPVSPWQAVKQARDRAWRLYLAALRDRDWAATQFVHFAQRGLEDPFTIFAAEILAAAYDAELLTDYWYDLAAEVVR